MKKNNQSFKRTAIKLFAFLPISLIMASCVNDDLFELYEDEEMNGTQFLRKKSKQDTSTGVTSTWTPGGGGNTYSYYPSPNTCALCVYAYYKTGGKYWERKEFKDQYYYAFNLMMQRDPTFLSEGVSREDTEWLLGKTYHEVKSDAELYDILNAANATSGGNAKQYVIRGKYNIGDGKPHVAVLKSISKNSRTGKVTINTIETGPGDSKVEEVWGYFR